MLSAASNFDRSGDPTDGHRFGRVVFTRAVPELPVVVFTPAVDASTSGHEGAGVVCPRREGPCGGGRKFFFRAVTRPGRVASNEPVVVGREGRKFGRFGARMDRHAAGARIASG